MRFLLERSERQKCWKIYDIQHNRQIEEPTLILTIGDSQMDNLLTGYCIAQGAIELWQLEKDTNEK